METSLYSTPRGQLFKQCPPKTPLQQSTEGMKLSSGTALAAPAAAPMPSQPRGPRSSSTLPVGRLKTMDISQPGEKGWTPVCLGAARHPGAAKRPSCLHLPAQQRVALFVLHEPPAITPCWIAAPAQAINLACKEQTLQNQQAVSPKLREKPAK